MNKKKKSQIAFLLAVFLASLIIRFYQLGIIPNGLSTDEADMGYNAYSIIQTGKDVYGRKYPLFFQSLDDYKPGLVFYTTIPAVAIFTLNDFSVRLAPAIFGSLLPIIIFFLSRKIYPKSKSYAYIPAVLFTFAPAIVGLSRAMVWYIEVLFLYALALLLFFLSLKKRRLLPLSAVVLALTVYVYYAAIIYLPLIVIMITILWKKHFLKFPKTALLSISILTLIILPAVIKYADPVTRTRLNRISALTPDIALPLSIRQMNQDKEEGFPLANIAHNRRFVYTIDALDNYFDYFNLDYLFINAKNIRYLYTNYVGLFYLVELPFFLYGLYSLIKRRQKVDILILGLLTIAPIPAMITLGSPFPHRAILLMLAIPLISAVGIDSLILNRPTFKFRKQILTLITVAFCANVLFFLHLYFTHSPKEFNSESNNGAWFSTVRDVIPQIAALSPKYGKVVFTYSSQKLVPPVYFLFYNKVDPKIIQEKSAGWTNEPPTYRQIYSQVENIEFRPINWKEDKKLKDHLFIVYPKEVEPDTYRLISKTYLPNGEEHFLIIEPL